MRRLVSLLARALLGAATVALGFGLLLLLFAIHLTMRATRSRPYRQLEQLAAIAAGVGTLVAMRADRDSDGELELEPDVDERDELDELAAI